MDNNLIEKNNKGNIFVGVVIGVLLIISIVSVSYIVYDKFIKEDEVIDNNNNNSNNNINNENNNNINVEKDITNDVIAKELYNELNAKVSSIKGRDISMHYKSASIGDVTSDNYMVTKAVMAIIDKNNVNIGDYSVCNGIGKYYKIEENLVINYIKEHFNTTVNYKKSLASGSYGANRLLGSYDESNKQFLVGVFGCGASGSETYGHSYMTKAVEKNNIITIYDSFIEINAQPGVTYISSYSDDSSANHDHACYWDDKNCDDLLNMPNPDNNEMFNYLKSNMANYFGEFKHTFKKASNGNYYWVSTEKIN